MKICAGHMFELSGAIRRKGMWPLVNTSNATHFAQRWLEGTAKQHEFDPLVVAALEVSAKAKQLCGDLLHAETCPLCQINLVLQNADASQAWIDNVSDLMLLTAKVNHLVH